MKLAVVSSVFNLRKTRPLEYYLIPTIHFLEDFSGIGIQVILYTDLNPNLFPKAKNIEIIQASADDFAIEMYGKTNWKEDYIKNVIPTFLEYTKLPELISIWLGKMIMLEYASKKADCVLWQDAGIKITKLCNRKIENYQRQLFNPIKYQLLSEILFKKYPLVFVKSDVIEQKYQGIDMNKYNLKNKTDYIRAGFIFARSNEATLLKQKIKDYWKILLENKDYGTEENPLTLYHWEREDSIAFSFNEWFNSLGIG